MKQKITIKLKNFLHWIWGECKDRNTLFLLLAVVFIMYTPAWGGYLLHAIFGWGWCSVAATAYILFWAGPFTPYFPVCIAITLSIKKAIQIRNRKKDASDAPADEQSKGI